MTSTSTAPCARSRTHGQRLVHRELTARNFYTAPEISASHSDALSDAEAYLVRTLPTRLSRPAYFHDAQRQVTQRSPARRWASTCCGSSTGRPRPRYLRPHKARSSESRSSTWVVALSTFPLLEMRVWLIRAPLRVTTTRRRRLGPAGRRLAGGQVRTSGIDSPQVTRW